MRAEKYTEICMRLKTTTFKNNIMKEARELFYDKNFVDTAGHERVPHVLQQRRRGFLGEALPSRTAG
jgi:hypothetical protein